MALKDLNVPAMLSISDQWLGHDLAMLQTEEILAPVIKLVDDAHKTLRTTQQRVGTTEQRIIDLTAKLTVADANHDRQLRAIFWMLAAAAELAESPDKAEAILAARDRLIPAGLSATQRTYREQAGNAQLAREQNTAEVQQFCQQIVVMGTPLVDVVEQWLATAAQIGDMNAERNKIAGDSDDGVSAGEVHRSRLKWIQAVNAFLTLLDFTSFDTDTRRRLLADLRNAEFQAARARQSGKNAAQQPLTPQEDQPQPV